MRWLASLLVAVAVSLLLFGLMFRLIHADGGQQASRPPPARVDISRVTPPTPQQQAEQRQAKQQPQLEALSVEPPPAPVLATAADVAISLPEEGIAWQADAMRIEQHYWSQPAGGAGSGGDYIGELDSGTREIVPISTTRPNIPKVAWDNRIDGWVLLAFTVSPDGKVSNIRVMDAEPRGVFEANAIAAVRGWIYQPFKGQPRFISQRIEFEWNQYPYNMDRD